jgi:hypothetical protein
MSDSFCVHMYGTGSSKSQTKLEESVIFTDRTLICYTTVLLDAFYHPVFLLVRPFVRSLKGENENDAFVIS